MEIIKLGAINSTNEYLKKFIVNNSLTTKHVVYTFNQTNGKGQRGKIWHSEPGKNLAFSICIFPKNIEVKNQFIINMIVSLFLINILKALKIPDLKIKWPNDIMSGGKKICGILNETKLKENWIESSKILYYLIDILKSENFSNSQLIRSKSVLIPIFYFLCLNNGQFSNNNDRKNAIYWLHMALIWGRYAGSADQKLEEDLNIIKENEPWNNLLSNPRGRSVNIFERNTFEPWDNVFNSIKEDVFKLKNKALNRKDRI